MNIQKDNRLISVISIVIACAIGLLLINVNKTNLVIIGVFFVVLFFSITIFKRNFPFMLKAMLYFIIISIPFPLLLQMLGKDAITLTTIVIFFLLFSFLMFGSFNKTFIDAPDKILALCPLLLIICFTLTIFFNPGFLGQSFRHYVGNLSGIFLFFLVLAALKTKEEVILSIKLILWVLLIQSLVAFLQLKFPGLAELIVAPFRTRTFYGEAPVVEGILRSTGTMWDYELLAEWFLMGIILSLALVYELQEKKYLFFTIANLSGIVFTKTRSDLILFPVILILVFLLTLKKERRALSLKVLFIIGLLVLLTSFFILSEIKLFYERLLPYFSSTHLLSPEALNRKEAWNEGVHGFLARPTLFGNGFYDITSLNIHTFGSFHSLYLTILYKMGVITFLVYLAFWWRMLYLGCDRLFLKRKISNWYVLFFLFIAVVFILIDNFKIEYVRYSHTIQFVWLLYGLLVVSIRQAGEKS